MIVFEENEYEEVVLDYAYKKALQVEKQKRAKAIWKEFLLTYPEAAGWLAGHGFTIKKGRTYVSRA